MRSVSLLTVLMCLALLVGCSSAPSAPQADPVAAAPVAQPVQQPPVETVDTMSSGAAPGERVIKVIKLPKGQTPYDLPGA